MFSFPLVFHLFCVAGEEKINDVYMKQNETATIALGVQKVCQKHCEEQRGLMCNWILPYRPTGHCDGWRLCCVCQRDNVYKQRQKSRLRRNEWMSLNFLHSPKNSIYETKMQKPVTLKCRFMWFRGAAENYIWHDNFTKLINGRQRQNKVIK